MKAILIIFLTIILGIVGYNYYTNWKRFNPPSYEYVADAQIDLNHPNKSLALDYYQAIEKLNGHVITQYTANDIDVRNPEEDDKTTLAAVAKYNELQGTVKFYESQLRAPVVKEAKKTEAQIRNELVSNMYNENPKSLQIGNKGALVFELQRLLNKHGEAIKIDGVFNTETFAALKSFEEKNGLYVDGKLDAMTLDYLLQ